MRPFSDPRAGPFHHHHRSFALATAKRAHARGKRATKIARAKTKPHINSVTKPQPRPHGNRIVFAPELLADIRRRYETTPETFDSLVIDLGASRSTLRNIALREHWVRYVPPPRGLSRAAEIAAEAQSLEAQALEADAQEPAALSSPPPERGRSPCEARREGVASTQQETPSLTLPLAGGGDGNWSLRERIGELRNAVDDEIAAVRALRARLKGVPHSAEAAGRVARTLADLTTTLERLHRLEIGAPHQERQDSYDDLPADPDAFRDELARRIRAFVASRTGPRDADGNSGPAAVDEVR